MIEIEDQPAEGDAAVLLCRGRLDMVAATRLREAVGERVSGGSRRVVLDLGETTFLDSSGLGALIASLKTARQAGGDLRIARAGEQVQMVLELTQMQTVLRPYATVEDALGAG